MGGSSRTSAQTQLRVLETSLKLPKFSTLSFNERELDTEAHVGRKPKDSTWFLLPAKKQSTKGGDPSLLESLVAWIQDSFVMTTTTTTPMNGEGNVSGSFNENSSSSSSSSSGQSSVLLDRLHGHRKPPPRPGRGGSARLRASFQSTTAGLVSHTFLFFSFSFYVAKLLTSGLYETAIPILCVCVCVFCGKR